MASYRWSAGRLVDDEQYYRDQAEGWDFIASVIGWVIPIVLLGWIGHGLNGDTAMYFLGALGIVAAWAFHPILKVIGALVVALALIGIFLGIVGAFAYVCWKCS